MAFSRSLNMETVEMLIACLSLRLTTFPLPAAPRSRAKNLLCLLSLSGIGNYGGCWSSKTTTNNLLYLSYRRSVKSFALLSRLKFLKFDIHSIFAVPVNVISSLRNCFIKDVFPIPAFVRSQGRIFTLRFATFCRY